MSHDERLTDTAVVRGDVRGPRTSTRSVLASVVAQFAREWETASSPPDLSAHLPDVPALRRISLIELIKVDLAYRWRRNDDPQRLAAYCAAFPELADQPLPPDLIIEEFRCMRRKGLVGPEHFAEEFPDQERVLKLWLNGGDSRSTLIAPPRAQGALDVLDAGQRVDDFDLLEDLGSGAFARVFLARQRSMNRLVALKISHNRGREPQTLAHLNHQSIVRVFDQRLIEHRDLKLMYMEYVPGGTLLGVLERAAETQPDQRRGRILLDAIDVVLRDKGHVRPSETGIREDIATLSWPETVAWLGSRLADALDYSARNGVLHRDIKPANVLLTAEGVPMLADFNISFSNYIAGVSPIAYFGGSLVYMSPEQLEACHPHLTGTAADLDVRSDIYALGVMLWELLTGRRPFDDEVAAGESETSLERMLQRRSRGVDPGSLPPDCPATLRRVLLTCLAPAPRDRWSSGAELAQQFDLCLDAHARDLVDPPPNSWRRRLRRWMIPIVSLAVLVPNVLAAVFNIRHTFALIISKFPAEALQHLELTTTVINLTFFPLGAAIDIYLCRYVLSVSRGLRKNRTYDAHTLARTRADVLLMGDRLVLVAFGLWVAADLAFLIVLMRVAGNLSVAGYVHFLAALAIFGAIAVAYPFFLVTFYVVRCIYPMFLQPGVTGLDDVRRLRRLDRRCNVYLAIAATVPLAGVAGATFIPAAERPLVILTVRSLCVGGIVALVGAYWLFRKLEGDLGALTRVVAVDSKRAGRISG